MSDTADLPQKKPLDLETHWLWEPYLACGTVALLDGDPGVGKSLITLDLAARLTTGQPMPDGKPCPPRGGGHPVILVNVEDTFETTILPRFAAAGGTVKHLHTFGGLSNRNLDRPIASLPAHFAKLVEWVDRYSPSLIVLDPFAALFPQDVSTNLDQSIRTCLTPFARLAAAYRCGVLFVRHLNKSPTRRPIYRGGGSIGIAACARSTLLAGKHPDDPDRCVLTQVKNNLGPRGPALGYGVTANGPFAAVAWDGPTNVTPEDLCRDDRHDPASKLAETWLKEVLSKGPVPAAEIEAKALAHGFGYRTIQFVKKRLKIDSRRIVIDGKQMWEWLPAEWEDGVPLSRTHSPP